MKRANYKLDFHLALPPRLKSKRSNFFGKARDIFGAKSKEVIFNNFTIKNKLSFEKVLK